MMRIMRRPAAAGTMKRPAASMRRPAGAAATAVTSKKAYKKLPPALREAVKKECEDTLAMVGEPEQIAAWLVDGRYICPLCPTKSFAESSQNNHIRDLSHHVEKEHVGKELGTSSDKVIRTMASMYNHEQTNNATHRFIHQAGRQPLTTSFLSRAAHRIREQMKRSPSWPACCATSMKKGPAKFDKLAALLLDVDDTRYILKEDTNQFHQISAQYWCTDKHLWLFLAALIHPDTKGAFSRVSAFMKERCGSQGDLLPKDPSIFHTLCEVLFQHPVIKASIDAARREFPKDMITIDGQWSSLLSVLYQHKHGQRKPTQVNQFDPRKHVALSVRCPEAVLGIKAQPSEKLEYQLEALQEAVGVDGPSKVRALGSDRPDELDDPATHTCFYNLECVFGDAMHISFKVEQAKGSIAKSFGGVLKRCLAKFKYASADRSPYYKKGGPLPRAQTLEVAMASMTRQTAKGHMRKIRTNSYPQCAYDSANAFVIDLAAMCITHPGAMNKRIHDGGKSTTVLSSLKFATSPSKMGYLMNGPKFGARNPQLKAAFGTLANEAFHRQLVSFFRNIYVQTGRNADRVLNIMTFVKLVGAQLQKTSRTAPLREHELMRMAANFIMSSDAKFVPRVVAKTVHNAKVDLSSLPQGVRVARKRPASSSSTARKRPASSSNAVVQRNIRRRLT
jgi:hypothetical protein